MDDRFASARVAWLKEKIETLGLKKRDVCDGAKIKYKTLSNWLNASTEPTLTADQWIGLAKILRTDLTILLHKFSKDSQELEEQK
mgnify:FL=1